MKTRFRLLVAYQTHPSRWWYLPFLLVQGGLGILTFSGGYGNPESLSYFVVALVFLVQTMRPTVLGWWATMAVWFAGEFLQPLHDRIVYQIPDFSVSFLVLWGLAPLFLLWFIRPRPPRPAFAAKYQNMRTFRYVLSWFYLVLGVFNGWVAILIVPQSIMESRLDTHHPLMSLAISIAMGLFIFTSGLVFLMAWWVLRRDQSNAKRWVIAASLMNLFVSLGIPLVSLHAAVMTSTLWPLAKLFAIPAAFGVAGFFAYPISSAPRVLPPSPAGPIHQG